MSADPLTFTAVAGRLDAALSELSGVSRSQVAQLIASGQVLVDGQLAAKSSVKLRGGETLSLTLPPPRSAHVLPEDVILEVLYEDDALIALNKPAGMTTHPAPGVTSGTLVNALLGRMKLPEQDDFDTEGGYRPGIVHRLDKDTSGVIVVAKTVAAHAALSESFKARETQKVYLAIVAGQWKAERVAEVDAPIGRHLIERQHMTVGGSNSRDAQTRFVPLAQHPDGHGRTLALVRCEPRTGRTHQLRVHLAHLGSPIVGDKVYGRASEVIGRQALHAWQLTIPHPTTGEELHLTAPPPEDLLSAWVALGGALPSALAN
ncbi:RluA family pseudouridine synthase [Deinococcus detaillensis]|uniref:Pseudouridine synthase n=1 Tax=Deinococcus detaillensis TaxID=2592048 RepID=A0A553UXC6_9DEIO|nr:RluA family pseudouridine synthase [Deinococcus detaillensis]TSA84671.1 RluA family pseudouridine synthase [Deinococcus detaillensis]